MPVHLCLWGNTGLKVSSCRSGSAHLVRKSTQSDAVRWDCGLRAAPHGRYSSYDTPAILCGIGCYMWGTGPYEKQRFFPPQTHRLGCLKTVKDNTEQFHLFSQLPFRALLIPKGKRRKSICISISPLGLQRGLLTHLRRGNPPIFSVAQVGAGESKQ